MQPFTGAPRVRRIPTCGCSFLACLPDENRPLVEDCTSLLSKYLTRSQDVSKCAPLYLGPRAALAGGWPRNAPAGAVLTFPGESCFAIFPGGPIESAGKKQSSGLFLRPRVPGLGACYRGPSICVATFHRSPSGGFLFVLLFFLGYVPVHFPLRGGLIRRGVAADDISFAAIFCFN